MSGTNRLLASIAALTAALATWSTVGMGTAVAADRDTGDTDISVRAGDGSTAVNSAGRGYANQQANQQRTDTSTHSRTENSPRTDSHNTTNSHNSSVYRDSHDVRRY